jgi:hypothetical protein
MSKPEPWGDGCHAKEILRQYIIDRKVTRAMKSREVYEMRPEFQQYRFARFSDNLRNLFDVLERNDKRAEADAAALAHDRTIHPVGPETAKGCGYPRWEGSDAQRLLKMDIDAGRNKEFKPKELHKSRMEYQAFPLHVFRDHIYQETRDRLGKSYWLDRKKNQKK